MDKRISYRIASIDILRGLIMIIMALDHTRDFFHFSAMFIDPVNSDSTTVTLYFTRWITHFCAPTFVFLSGTSAYLSSQNKTPQQAGSFLMKRGIWLVLFEMILMTFILTFNPFYNLIIWQVIWAIGCSMIILSLLRRISFSAVFVAGVILFLGHNLLDYINLPQKGVGANLWKIFFYSPR